MSLLVDHILWTIPSHSKRTPSGWTSFNAPCCLERGHGKDTKKRGGIIQADGGISYHCFNCGFKTSWQPGRPLSRNMKLFLKWMGVSDDNITKIAFDIMRQNESKDAKEFKAALPTFETITLPEGAQKIKDIKDINDDLYAVIEYMAARDLNFDDIDYYWSPDPRFRDKFIIPCFYQKRLVGWVSRTINKDFQPKYIVDVQPGFVFNLDEQGPNKSFCILCEGHIDAIHVEGCALGGFQISKQQEMLLNKLQKQIIVVPDRDHAGRNLMKQALDLGWQVSMPDWDKSCKDIGDAVKLYGRLYTLYSIVSAAEESPLKIKLRAKTWFSSKNI